MKKASGEFSNNSLAFKQVLKLLDYQLKSIEKIGADSNLVSVYRRLLKHLRTLKSNQIDAILEARGTSHKQESKSYESDEQLLKLTLDEIEVKVQSEDSARKYLEKIAAVRFGMTKGELSSISNKRRLVEQLLTLINNEKAHQSIKRMASSKDADNQ